LDFYLLKTGADVLMYIVEHKVIYSRAGNEVLAELLASDDEERPRKWKPLRWRHQPGLAAGGWDSRP